MKLLAVLGILGAIISALTLGFYPLWAKVGVIVFGVAYLIVIFMPTRR